MSSDEQNYPTRVSLNHDIPGWVERGSVFFITVCAKERGKNTLATADLAPSLLQSIAFQHERKHWFVFLALLMPDHLHALICFSPETIMDGSIAAWKSYNAKRTGVRWQREFFDHRLRSGESYSQKFAYIRQNPVRAKLVEHENDWPCVWTPPEEERALSGLPSRNR